jgi:hypothetical protein
MFEKFARITKGHLGRLLSDGSRWAHAFWIWYQESRCASESEVRGLRLLREWLSPKQLAQFDAHKYFDVIGCQSGKRYRLRYGTQMNIYELDPAGRPLSGWCFVPKDGLVPGDVVLAQKIALETDELAAMRIAKYFVVRRWGRVV